MADELHLAIHPSEGVGDAMEIVGLIISRCDSLRNPLRDRKGDGALLLVPVNGRGG
jgi:hypothetical protein